jgi:hypothetical protein
VVPGDKPPTVCVSVTVPVVLSNVVVPQANCAATEPDALQPWTSTVPRSVAPVVPTAEGASVTTVGGGTTRVAVVTGAPVDGCHGTVTTTW